MTKKKNNIGGLLDNLREDSAIKSNDKANNAVNKPVVNPAVGLATNSTVKRASSIKEPVLTLSHDQVRFFKYHDRHDSSIETAKVAQIKKSIEEEGQHFPGIVRKTSDITPDGRLIYELVVGRLRFEASRGVGVFKAFLKDLTDVEATKVMFSENEDRQDITPFERWLSILPLVNDKVLESREIASLIGWDPGNLSRSLKAIRVYQECDLSRYLKDVTKVKLSALIELSNLYLENEKKVKQAISFVEDNYSNRRDNLFLKAVIQQVREVSVPDSETIFLSGSKVSIKRKGDSVELSFKGLPQESEFPTIIEKLKNLNALR